MRHIMVMNAKGGCGKSTLATNIAAWFAQDDAQVALADFDPQGSCLDWLDKRPDNVPEIQGVAAWNDGLRGITRGTDFVIMDTPAGVHGSEITDLVRRAETIIVPVLPSPIDMRASARYVNALLEQGKVERRKAKVGLVGNRVRENTLIFDELDEFLDQQKAPYLTSLRDAQNYIRAYSRGLGVCELPEYLAWPDWEQWEPLLEWLESKRSY